MACSFCILEVFEDKHCSNAGCFALSLLKNLVDPGEAKWNLKSGIGLTYRNEDGDPAFRSKLRSADLAPRLTKTQIGWPSWCLAAGNRFLRISHC